MNSISYSAPAKLILSGEHAVVYGKPALLCALDLRLTVSLFRNNRTLQDATMDMISKKVKLYLHKKEIKFETNPYSFKITSDIPQSKNLGSSAALSVASVAVFLHFYTGKSFDKEIINEIAYEIEKNFHGNPSGADNSTSCYGGLIYYRKEFEFLKLVTSLSITFPKQFSDHLFIIDSGKPIESTKEMVVNIVGKQHENKPKKVEQIFIEIEKLTKQMVLSINANDIREFKFCIVENEKQLEKLGAVSSKTKLLLSQLSKFGDGKVTGAGGIKKGSGNLLFLANNPKKFKQYLREKDINYFTFKQDFEGVKQL